MAARVIPERLREKYFPFSWSVRCFCSVSLPGHPCLQRRRVLTS